MWNVDYQVVQCVCSQCSSVYPSIHTKVLGAFSTLHSCVLLCPVFIHHCIWYWKMFCYCCVSLSSVVDCIGCVINVSINVYSLHPALLYLVFYQVFNVCLFVSLPLLQYLEILEWGCICMCDGFCFGLGDYWNDCQTLTVGLLWNVYDSLSA